MIQDAILKLFTNIRAQEEYDENDRYDKDKLETQSFLSLKVFYWICKTNECLIIKKNMRNVFLLNENRDFDSIEIKKCINYKQIEINEYL